MNASTSREPVLTARPVAGDAERPTLGELAPQLRDMLADEDWLPACPDVDALRALLRRLEQDPDAATQAPAADVALLLAAHQDFSRFRRALAARLNTPDDRPLHITPDEWLYLRLRHADKATNLAPYAEYRLQEDRFKIVD